jgi:hypothetical protein
MALNAAAGPMRPLPKTRIFIARVCLRSQIRLSF